MPSLAKADEIRMLGVVPKSEVAGKGEAQASTRPHLKQLPLHDATELTEGGDQANIRLSEKIYTLRITRAGKLILTK